MLELTDALQTVTVASKFYCLVGVVVFFPTLHQLYEPFMFFGPGKWPPLYLGSRQQSKAVFRVTSASNSSYVLNRAALRHVRLIK